MKQLTVNRETGYDLDALSYLYFNSEIIKEMDNVFSKPQSSKQKSSSSSLSNFKSPLDKMMLTT